jgi:PadR family transcriptional regulator PadR
LLLLAIASVRAAAAPAPIADAAEKLDRARVRALLAQHIQMLSADVLTIEEGSLYPALQRMLVKRWVLAEWKISANNRRARFYKLTTAGKKQLGIEESRFSQMFGAIMRVMKTT